MSNNLILPSRNCPEPGCKRKLAANGECYAHGRIAEPLTIATLEAASALTDLANPEDLIEVRRSGGRPKGTGKTQFRPDRWHTFVERAVDVLAERCGRQFAAALKSLGLDWQEDRIPAHGDTPGVIPMWPERDLKALIFCIVTANRTVSWRQAGFECDTSMPSLEWAQAWMAMLEENRCLAAALAEDCGLDAVCGAAYMLGCMVIPIRPFIEAAKNHAVIRLVHNLPEERLKWQTDALQQKREFAIRVAKYSVWYRRIVDAGFFAGYTHSLGWRGSENWEERYRQYQRACDYVDSEKSFRLPRATDARHLRLIAKRTGEFLRREYPEAPEHWEHLVTRDSASIFQSVETN
jgi:hypothetical protein